ncbi:sporulation integral membrane protein YlbJ [Bacillus songklensis]|uniref:Sporulation integral membrane protein YlbJ n=1 Tax=Bacillus songklensis TaxID=1069116 RepID=A0ABV8AYF6_9BACI
MNKSFVKTLALAVSASILASALIIYPKEAFDASIRGLNMWWTVVFPSLLPFFIFSEMLIGFGVVRFIGVLLEPFMRPLFRVPGVGGFVLAMGMASGFPAGAKLTARLRQEGQITSSEAERLVSFTNSSNPLFIFGAIAVGFFKNPNVGIILALSHYLGNLCVGFVMRFHGIKNKTDEREKRACSIKNALLEMHETRLKDKRPIGKLLGDAVTSSIQTLLMIGGFIILFSVLNRLLSIMSITTMISSFFSYLLTLFGVSKDLSLPLISGIFEITLGSQMTSQVNEAALWQQIVIVSFILAFSGFSVQAQVASILSETDIRFSPFFIARLFHGLFSVIFSLLLWKPLSPYILSAQPTVRPAEPDFLSHTYSFDFLNEYVQTCIQYGPLLTIFSLCLYIHLRVNRWKTN